MIERYAKTRESIQNMPLPITDPFLPDRWKQLAGVSAPGDEPGVIVGPMDALNVIEYRKRFEEAGFQFGVSSPTDVFLFSVGVAPSRSQTKIGGLPYLFKADRWPVDSAGRELPFVGQFDFRDSLDLVGSDTKGDLLLIFGDLPSSEDSPEVKLLWQNVTSKPLVEENDIPRAPAFDEFYATRWRTENFPNAQHDDANKSLARGRKSISCLACTLFATQIGRDPFLLAYVPSSMQQRVLCCLAPVLPAHDGPFPFFNEAYPLLEKRGDFDYRYDDKHKYVEQWLSWGDSTSLYILVDKHGAISAEFIIG